MTNETSVRCVIIADGHFNPLGLCRSLGKADMRPDVVVVDGEGSVITKSKYPKSIAHVENNAQAVDYVLKHFSSTDKKTFLMTGSDKTIAEIDRRYNEISPYFITYNCGAQGEINRFMSKALQNRLASAAGLKVPDYEEVNVGDLPQHVDYPIITKAVDSRVPGWKSQVHICNNEAELKEAYTQLHTPRILLQHYVAKKNETGFNGISINRGKDVYLPLQLSYYSTEVDTFGNSIYLFKPTDDDLVQKIKKLIKSTGYEGSFSVDFIIGEDNEVYFLEINFRNSGWAYPYTNAGVNLPAIWVKSMLTGRLETDDVKIKRLPYSAIVDLWEVSAQMKRGWRAGLKSMWQTLISDSYIFWDRHDTGPFWYIVKGWMKTHILRK